MFKLFSNICEVGNTTVDQEVKKLVLNDTHSINVAL